MSILLLTCACDGDGNGITDPAAPRVVGTYSASDFWTYTAHGALPGVGPPPPWSCPGQIVIANQDHGVLSGRSVYQPRSQTVCLEFDLAATGVLLNDGSLTWSDGLQLLHERLIQHLGCTAVTVPSEYTGRIDGNELSLVATSVMVCPGGEATFAISASGRR